MTALGSYARLGSAFLPLATLIAAGCASRKLPKELRGEPRWCSPWEEAEEEIEEVETRCMEVCKGNEERGDTELNVLVLSGGGAHGAWGAGVLNGWRESGSRPRPDFDLVTGVSTGALIGTFAFLDEPKYDERLKRIYTGVTNRDIYGKRFLPMALFKSSLETSDPLEDLIAREMTDDVIREVARKASDGRKFLVGTVNLDKGCFVAWDMTKIAQEGEFRLYRKVLLASASEPVFWPPVMIRNQMHFDGGLREQLFVRSVVRSLCSHARKPLNFYVVVNGKLGVRSAGIDLNLKDIALRSIEILVDEVQVGNLRRVFEIVKEQNEVARAQNSPALARCFLTSIPLEHKLTSGSHEFDRKKMNGLFEAGFAFGKKGAWREKAPENDPPRAPAADHPGRHFGEGDEGAEGSP